MKKETHILARKKVCPEDIVVMLADVNYTTLFFENGSKLIVATTLKKLEKRFLETNLFFRNHKSSMVNLSFIESFSENSIQMKNQFLVSLSRRKKDILKEIMILNP